MKQLNRVVDSIEVDGSTVTFSTSEVAIKNLFKLKKKTMIADLTNLSLTLVTNSALSRRFGSEVYSFAFQKEKYFIVKDFFDGFKSFIAIIPRSE
jgi:hypothetical protein